MYRRTVFGELVPENIPFFTQGPDAMDAFRELDSEYDSDSIQPSDNHLSPKDPDFNESEDKVNSHIVKAVDKMNHEYFVTSLGGKEQKQVALTKELKNTQSQKSTSKQIPSNRKALNRGSRKLESRRSSCEKRLPKRMTFRNPQLKKSGSVHSVLSHRRSITSVLSLRDTKKLIKPKFKPEYDHHLVRLNNSRKQVFGYPNYMSLPILKIIEEELNNELEIKDDIEMKNLNSNNRAGEKTIKKSKFEGNDEFKKKLKKIKLAKVLEKFRRNEGKKKRKQEKRQFYFIEDYEAQNPIHHLDPNYQELVKEKKAKMEYLQSVFSFPFDKEKFRNHDKKLLKRKLNKMKLYEQIMEKLQSNQDEVELAHPFTLRNPQKCRTQQFHRNQLAKKIKPEPLSIRKNNDKPSRISFGPSGGEKDASTPLLTIGKKPLSQFTKILMRSSSMTKSQMSDIGDQFLSPIRQFKDYKPTFDIIGMNSSKADKFKKVRMKLHSKAKNKYKMSFNLNTSRNTNERKRYDLMRKSADAAKMDKMSEDSHTLNFILQVPTIKSHSQNSSQKSTKNPTQSASKICENLDSIIAKSNKFLTNDEAREIVELHKQLLYADREIIVQAQQPHDSKASPNELQENPFLEKDEDSEYEDSETDDQKTRMLRQLKRSVDVMHKFRCAKLSTDRKEQADASESGVSTMSVRRIIQSPLKLSLSQIFQGYENEELTNDEIKRKFYKRLGRDIHFQPNYEHNINIIS
ncbi:unnamed protein product [Moneuplotes crassus]|uniref:Uncharacterized protein n=1 Tax=Euplotes crassus TaxID=5936 RepID=A0AAD1XZP4_EUPCR|nr:unnamed protein product [Moneuplotes crassus]